MCAAIKKAKGFTVRAYAGDAKTLLAFNLPDRASAKNLAGFTVQCSPNGDQSFYLQNTLQFATPGDHTQDAKEPPNSSINAPIHKFRWLHIPGSLHQGVAPRLGKYTYTVTPRYFNASQSLTALDPNLSVSVTVNVQPFRKGQLQLGFTRGFTQSQAFVHHFGRDALIRPKGNELLFDTSVVSGSDAQGNEYTYEQEYEWLGFTARERIFELVDEVVGDKSLTLRMFAYDLNEPDLLGRLLTLAKQGRVRLILDDAALHHSAATPTAEDQFAKLFAKAAKKDADILRGHFGRYAHDKVMIVSNAKGAVKVLTGSTNFSVTGLYVNSNHVLVFNDPKVAGKYSELFEEVWAGNVKKPAYLKLPIASETFTVPSSSTPSTEITFAPHTPDVAAGILDDLVTRIAQEGKRKGTGSVLFAVMAIDKGTSAVYTALKELHADENIFSFGISDNPGGIALYSPGRKTGVLVTGKPTNTQLPPPFNQVRNIGGVGHQVHHKFVVCGFNGPDPVVYCGSSNLAQGGEENNGDNLLAIRDPDVAVAFMIEALALVDHFQFLDRSSKAPNGKQVKTPPASKQQLALSAGWYLSTTDKWVDAYYDAKDLRCMDRLLFA